MEKKGAQRERIFELLDHAPVLDLDTIRRVASEVGVPEADVWGAARFYTLLARPDAGVRVCQGPTCQHSAHPSGWPIYAPREFHTRL